MFCMPPEPLNSTSRTRFAAGNLRRWLGRFWSAPSASPFFIQGVAAAYERGRDARRQLRHVLAQRLRQHAAAEGGAAEHGRQGRVRRRRALGGRDDLTDVRGAAGTICGPLALACLVEPPDGDSVSLELRVQVGLGHGRRAAGVRALPAGGGGASTAVGVGAIPAFAQGFHLQIRR